jgi:diguanylate cyclase (GGDEF)-like protein/PAS domain S-box-containing protein
VWFSTERRWPQKPMHLKMSLDEQPPPRHRSTWASDAPHRLRRNARPLLVVLAALGALIATVVFLEVRAAEKDDLRQAQTGLSLVTHTLSDTVAPAEALLAAQTIDPRDYRLEAGIVQFQVDQRAGEGIASKGIGITTSAEVFDRAAAAVSRHWSAAVAREIRIDSKLLVARTARLMQLTTQRDLHKANEFNETYVQPLANELLPVIANANTRLAGQIEATDRQTWEATFGVVGATATLLIALVVGLELGRRRRQRAERAQLRYEIEQEALRASRQRLATLVEHGSDMITVVAADGTVIYQAGAVQAMLGYEPAELEGAKLSDWLEPADRPVLEALCTPAGPARAELSLRHRDGSTRVCEAHAANLLEDPAWKGVVLNIWDLSERKALEDRLRHQASHDTLTGLPNRMLVLDRAQQMLARARRKGSPVAALYIDLDGFKHVNDTFGHAAGDTLLRLVASRLSSAVRAEDIAARLGGDEFIVLVDGSTLDCGPELVAERMLGVLEQPYEIAGVERQLTLTASIGISVRMRGEADELLRDADLALYEAKALGRNRYVLFEAGMQTSSQDRLTLEMDLAEALQREELFLLYQPTVDLHSERVIGVEALIRWRHPTRGVLAPSEFVPIAEESGLIVPIGRWVLAEACKQATSWRRRGHMIGMSVNVSTRQLESDQLIDDVRIALKENDLEPATLTLEVTETTLMREADASAKRLADLKALGVRIAIDDFGTGYSSLAYLRQFAADTLKIDRSFISGIAASTESAALVRTLVQLGKTLGVETLAEGIENEPQLQQLRRERCDHGQGFLFSPPLEAEAMEAYLEGAGSRRSALAAG